MSWTFRNVGTMIHHDPPPVRWSTVGSHWRPTTNARQIFHGVNVRKVFNGMHHSRCAPRCWASLPTPSPWASRYPIAISHIIYIYIYIYILYTLNIFWNTLQYIINSEPFQNNPKLFKTSLEMINICGGRGGFVHNFVATWLQEVAMSHDAQSLEVLWHIDGHLMVWWLLT